MSTGVNIRSFRIQTRRWGDVLVVAGTMASEQNDAIPLLVKANQDEDVSTHPPIGVNSSPYRRGLGVTIAAVILCAAYPVSTALTATSPVVPVECANGGFMQQVRRTMVKNKGISPTIGILTQPNDLGSEFSKLGSSMLLRKIVDWLPCRETLGVLVATRGGAGCSHR